MCRTRSGCARECTDERLCLSIFIFWCSLPVKTKLSWSAAQKGVVALKDTEFLFFHLECILFFSVSCFCSFANGVIYAARRQDGAGAMFTETRPLNPTHRSAKSANETKPFNLRRLTSAMRWDPEYSVVSARITSEAMSLGERGYWCVTSRFEGPLGKERDGSILLSDCVYIRTHPFSVHLQYNLLDYVCIYGEFSVCLSVFVPVSQLGGGRGGRGSHLSISVHVSSHNEVSSGFGEMCDTSCVHRQTDCYVRCEMMVWGVCMHRCPDRWDNFKAFVVRLDLNIVSVFIWFWMWLIMQISRDVFFFFFLSMLSAFILLHFFKWWDEHRHEVMILKSVFVSLCIFRFIFSCSNHFFSMTPSCISIDLWFACDLAEVMAGFQGSIGFRSLWASGRCHPEDF